MDQTVSKDRLTIYTIGHSNHSLETFLKEDLRGHIFKCHILLKGCTGVSMGLRVAGQCIILDNRRTAWREIKIVRVRILGESKVGDRDPHRRSNQ